MIHLTPIAAVAARAVSAPACSFLTQKVIAAAAAGESSSHLPMKAISSLAPAILLRGGGSPTVLDLAHIKIRLEGFHAYGVVTTLMLNAALRLFSSTPKAKEGMVEGESVNNAAKLIFTAFILLSVISGLYTTVVFSLIGMYSKTALGLDKDVKTLNAFFASTQSIRDNAYHAFILSLVSFSSSFVLSLFLNYKGETRWWLVAVATALSLFSWWQWSTIIHAASQLIFS
mmetsp:Transcript_23986/g.43484  ORF Transcript_23986/g.43484 Transcript_23986/m.43484 type:complete len:229 (+) Transcript_23986:65-751(+)